MVENVFCNILNLESVTETPWMPSTTITVFESADAKLTKCDLDATEYEMIQRTVR